MVYRELPKGCFEVTIKFTFPNNFENYQQAGGYFLDEAKNRIHNVRMTYVHAESEAYTEYPRGYQIVKRNHGEPFGHLLREITKTDSFNHSFYFKILKQGNKFSFYAHKKEENAAYYLVHSLEFDFIPNYLALVSFNGYRNSDEGPLNTASTIPARFDWVRVDGGE